MKIIAVGDIHGRDLWKKIAKKESDFDKFVFIGDYFDNFPPMTAGQIIENFLDICDFKRQNPDRVVMLIGNHELHYMHPQGEGERYSGYNEKAAGAIGAHLKDASDILQAAYQFEDLLFVHAGLTSTWAKRCGITPAVAGGNVARFINEIWLTHPSAFRFYDGDQSGCGEHVYQGPFWVRPEALLGDMYPGVRQIVGHTHTEGIETMGRLTMIDTGRAMNQYLKIQDGVFHEGRV